MGYWATLINNLTALNIVSGRKNTALNVRTVVGGISDAISYLEGLQRGAKILGGTVPPDPATGIDGDAYINSVTGDLFGKTGADWGLVLNLKGGKGKDGTNGSNGRTPVLGVDYIVTNGSNGKSAFEVWLANGNTGTQADYLASLKGRDGNRISTGATDPTSGGTVFNSRVPGDVHFQTISSERYSIWVNGGNSWASIYTTPAGATVADGAITNLKLADDVKVGSLAAAANAYPAVDRAGLTTVEKYLVYLGAKIGDAFTRIGNLDTGFGNVSTLVNAFNGRINALEARPTGGTTTTTPATTAATYPDQSAATVGLFLKSTGVASAQPVWAAVLNNKVGYVLTFKNEVSRTLRIFTETTVTKIQIDAGVSTLTYSVNGATAVNVVFTGGIYSPAANAPLVFAAGSLIAFSITYATNFTEASFQLIGNETL